MKNIHMFDIDSTLTGLDGTVRVLQEYFPEFKEEDLLDYDLRLSLIKSGHIDTEHDFDTYKVINARPHMFLEDEPRPYANEYLELLSKSGQEIQLITARYHTDYRYKYTLDWANLHFPNIAISEENLHFTRANRKVNRVSSALMKAHMMKKEVTVHLYEDKVETLKQCLGTYKELIRLYGIDKYATLKLYKVLTPYNKCYKPQEVRTIKCWSELL